MKNNFCILFLFAFCFTLKAQDTTRILFIGNSFTYANNMPQIVKALADSAHKIVEIGMHAPGGVSVGDTAQGTMAHMNNPVLFAMIHSKKWDFAVIQDNQGRFVQDSAVFPAKSKVVQGHLNIMDSVKANNKCAKIILFGGWAWKYGSPPFGNTGIECIQRILVNYRVLNDTMKEVIAPIGEAWIKAVNYLPSVNLWDVDDAHPAYEGSFLTASVIFSSIFNLPAQPLNYNGTLSASTSHNLKAFGDSSVFGTNFHSKYNLGGIKKIALQNTNGQLSIPGTFLSYAWYKNNNYVGNSSTLAITGPGEYKALVRESDDCLIKTCSYFADITTGIFNEDPASKILVFPNPVSRGKLILFSEEDFQQIELINLSGGLEKIISKKSGQEIQISITNSKPGCYTLFMKTEKQIFRKKIIISE